MIRKILLIGFLFVLSVSAVLLLCELLLRGSGIWSNDSYKERYFFVDPSVLGVPFLLKPNIHTEWGGVKIISNDVGIRESRKTWELNKDTKKILIIGDSVTFGLGIAQQDSFSQQMEALLPQLTGERYAVINAGISGFNASNEEALLEYLFPIYQPDIVVWCLLSNDFDDPLIVNKKGQVVGGRNYSVSSSYSSTVWGYLGRGVDKDNYINSICLRNAQTQHRNSSSFFAKILYTSYLYPFVKNRLASLTLSKKEPFLRDHGANVVQTRIPLTTTTGNTFYPELAPIFISPLFSNRFNSAIKKGSLFCSQQKTPMVILSFDCFVEKNAFSDDDLIHYQEITQYMGMPYRKFCSTYNLGWDPHYNKAGNTLIAKAIINYLSEIKLIEIKKNNFHAPKVSYKKIDSQFRLIRNSYIKTIRSWIDFDNFSNVDQVMGGVRSDAIFPLYSKKMYFLLGGVKNDIFRLRAYNNGQLEKIRISVSSTTQRVTKIAEMPSGDSIWKWQMPDNFQLQESLLDVSMECVSNCTGIELNKVGFW